MVTGILFSDISFFRNYLLRWDLAGYVNALHVIGAYLFALYLIVHLYMATLGRTAFSHTMAMITGYEEEPENLAEASAPLEAPLVSSELQKE